MPSVLERFLSKVEAGPIPERRPDLGPCRVWTGYRMYKGYGHFADGTRLASGYSRIVRAHRFAWELEHGPIPAGLEPDHLCENRACVEVRHMELVTHQENLNRRADWNTPRTHCDKGHEFTPENTYVRMEGVRPILRCRICKNANARRRSRARAN